MRCKYSITKELKSTYTLLYDTNSRVQMYVYRKQNVYNMLIFDLVPTRCLSYLILLLILSKIWAKATVMYFIITSTKIKKYVFIYALQDDLTRVDNSFL